MTETTLRHNNPLFVRSSPVLPRNDSSKKRRHLGLPSRTSSLIRVGHNDTVYVSEREMFAACTAVCSLFPPLVFCLLYIYCCVFFPSCPQKLPKQVRKAIGVIERYQVRELLY